MLKLSYWLIICLIDWRNDCFSWRLLAIHRNDCLLVKQISNSGSALSYFASISCSSSKLQVLSLRKDWSTFLTKQRKCVFLMLFTTITKKYNDLLFRLCGLATLIKYFILSAFCWNNSRCMMGWYEVILASWSVAGGHWPKTQTIEQKNSWNVNTPSVNTRLALWRHQRHLLKPTYNTEICQYPLPQEGN